MTSSHRGPAAVPTPPAISQQLFLDLLGGFLGGNVARVQAARATGSGWEIWLQVELCVFVREVTQGDIVRETAYLGNTAGRADFVLNSRQPSGGNARMVVEIKTNLLSEDAFTFVKRVGEDFEKQLDAPRGTLTLVVGVWLGGDPTNAIGGGEVVRVLPVVPGQVYLLQGGIA